MNSKDASRPGLVSGIFTAIFGIILGLTISEIVLRILAPDSLVLLSIFDERNLLYQYDSSLGWRPTPQSSYAFNGCRAISVQHNSLGFRDREHGNSEQHRLLVLGDSFIWGYDVEANERFTDLIQNKYPALNVVNLGVSGFGTDQELLLLRSLIDQLRPESVLLMYNDGTDATDNTSNIVYGGYYKPWFEKASDGTINLKGIPVPRSMRYALKPYIKLLEYSYVLRMAARMTLIADGLLHQVEVPDLSYELILQMKNLVESHNGKLLVGFTGSGGSLKGMLEREHIPTVSLNDAQKYSGCGEHWTPAGQIEVAGKIEALLQNAKIISLTR